MYYKLWQGQAASYKRVAFPKARAPLPMVCRESTVPQGGAGRVHRAGVVLVGAGPRVSIGNTQTGWPGRGSQPGPRGRWQRGACELPPAPGSPRHPGSSVSSPLFLSGCTAVTQRYRLEAFKTNTAHSPGGWTAEVTVPAQTGPGGDRLPGLQTASFPPCPRGREGPFLLSVHLLRGALIPS